MVDGNSHREHFSTLPQNFHTEWDFCLVKTDASGNVEWDETYGGTSDDPAESLIQTSDNGYALIGWTR